MCAVVMEEDQQRRVILALLLARELVRRVADADENGLPCPLCGRHILQFIECAMCGLNTCQSCTLPTVICQGCNDGRQDEGNGENSSDRKQED